MAKKKWYIALQSWAGLTYVPVRMMKSKHTKTKTRVKLLQSAKLPGRRFIKKGQTTLVPNHALRRR